MGACLRAIVPQLEGFQSDLLASLLATASQALLAVDGRLDEAGLEAVEAIAKHVQVWVGVGGRGGGTWGHCYSHFSSLRIPPPPMAPPTPPLLPAATHAQGRLLLWRA